MKKLTITFSSASILFILITILVSCLYLYSQINYQSYHQQTELIRDIQENTAELTLNILLVQKGQIQHYDEIAKVLSHTDVLISTLAAKNKDSFQPLLASWHFFKSNIEDLKSNHAVYQNSLRYFPKATENLLLELSTNKQNPDLINALLKLERQVMQFRLGHNQQTFNQLNNQEKVFNSFVKKLPKNTAFSVLMLSKHIQILLRKHVLIRQLNTQLLNTEIIQQTQLLLKHYNQNFQQQVDKASKVRLFFYIACLALLFIVVTALYKVKTLLSKLHNTKTLDSP